jgi:hypothetical protein
LSLINDLACIVTQEFDWATDQRFLGTATLDGGFVMHRGEPDLSEWPRLYSELEQARMRLQAETARPSPSPSVRARMQQEVERLQDLSDRALEVSYATLPARHFALLYGEWELAEEEAIRAEHDLFFALKAYRAGTGSPPNRIEIVIAKRLRAVARQRLRDLKTYADGVRGNAVLI